MRIIAVIIDEPFEDFEYSKIMKELKRERHEIVHLGTEKGSVIKGVAEIASVTIDETITQTSPANYDVLFIPGSTSPDRFKAREGVIHFVYRFIQSGKLIFTLGNGLQALIAADVLRGRLVTGSRGIAPDIKNAGAEFVDRPVAEDANLVSGRHSDDIPAFLKKVMERLG